ncbi:methyl-accepting chemotaxis protein [Nitratidesulfovibrio sp. 1201_IL3209]|uniref:methyl-accepting chemotaxis protein n=1 Tax=Nitratidesulfovibrio sp. 1201_IL3209 TaxID=3084053 RepID=UPI002FD965BA
MKFLRQFGITTRLVVLSLLAFFFIGAAGTAGWMGARIIQQNLKDVSNIRLPGLNYLIQADRDLQQLLVAERSLLFADPADRKAIDRLKKEYEDNLRQSDERWNKYKNLPLDDAARPLVPQYDAARAAWMPLSRAVMDAALSGDPAARQKAALVSLGEVGVKFEAMREVINQLTEIIEQAAREDNAEADASYGDTMYRLAGATILALLVLAGFSIAITRSVTVPLKHTVAYSEAVSRGALEECLAVDARDEVGVLTECLCRMVATLKDKIGEADARSTEARAESERARLASEEAEAARRHAESARREGLLQAADTLTGVTGVLGSASEELAAQIEQASRGAEHQMQRVSETATAMEQMNATVLEVARSVGEAAGAAEGARDKAVTGQDVVRQVVAGIGQVQQTAGQLKDDMAELGRQAEDIGRVMTVINDIADQTNLLALNAAIEAARAGDAGRGFAVVADEVRKLAEKTMLATREVGQAISGIQGGTRRNVGHVEETVRHVQEVTRLATESGESLGGIVSLAASVSDQVRSIATASEEQSAASEEINRSIEDISRVSSESAEVMRQSASAVADLAQQSHVLQELIRKMREEG